MHLIADIPTPEIPDFALWVVCFFAFVVGVNAIMDLIGKFKPTPPYAEQFASASSVESLAEALRDRDEKGDKSLGKIFDRLNEQDKKLAALTENSEQGAQRLTRIERKVDDIYTRNPRV